MRAKDLLPVGFSLAALVTTACERYIAYSTTPERREAYYLVLSDEQLVFLHSEVTKNPVTGLYGEYHSSSAAIRWPDTNNDGLADTVTLWGSP